MKNKKMGPPGISSAGVSFEPQGLFFFKEKGLF